MIVCTSVGLACHLQESDSGWSASVSRRARKDPGRHRKHRDRRRSKQQPVNVGEQKTGLGDTAGQALTGRDARRRLHVVTRPCTSTRPDQEAGRSSSRPVGDHGDVKKKYTAHAQVRDPELSQCAVLDLIGIPAGPGPKGAVLVVLALYWSVTRSRSELPAGSDSTGAQKTSWTLRAAKSDVKRQCTRRQDQVSQCAASRAAAGMSPCMNLSLKSK